MNDEEKRREIMNVSRNGECELLALTDATLKRCGKEEWRGMQYVYSGVEKSEREREEIRKSCGSDNRLVALNCGRFCLSENKL